MTRPAGMLCRQRHALQTSSVRLRRKYLCNHSPSTRSPCYISRIQSGEDSWYEFLPQGRGIRFEESNTHGTPGPCKGRSAFRPFQSSMFSQEMCRGTVAGYWLYHLRQHHSGSEILVATQGRACPRCSFGMRRMRLDACPGCIPPRFGEPSEADMMGGPISLRTAPRLCVAVLV